MPKTERKPRRTYTQEEQATYQNEMRTSGRKGCRAPRINLACTPETIEYIRTMSRLKGQTISQFVNDLIRKDMAEHDQGHY